MTAKIRRTHFIAGFSSFYFDDQAAVKLGAAHDGFTYSGAPVTPGFRAVRQPGECVSIVLELDDGQIAVGDCAAVQYSGAGGRDSLLSSTEHVPLLRRHVAPFLDGRDVSSFLGNARFFDSLEIDGRHLHTALRYGISQALLDATALATRKLKAEVIASEYHLPVVPDPVPLFGQSGDDRFNAVDKMILKRIDVLPHGLINNVPEKLGYHGEKLVDYVRWLVSRITKLRTTDAYQPVLHIDVYGTIGLAFGQDPRRIADYLATLEDAAQGFPLYIEGPIDAGSKTAQIEALGAIRARLKHLDVGVKLVADEWCNTFEDVIDFSAARCCDMVQIKTPDLGSVHNTVEAVLHCHEHRMEAYQGGTCNETEVSARTCVHLALASRPTRMLVKPGMGFDEGMTIVHNEMWRTLAVLRTRLHS